MCFDMLITDSSFHIDESRNVQGSSDSFATLVFLKMENSHYSILYAKLTFWTALYKLVSTHNKFSRSNKKQILKGIKLLSGLEPH